MLGGLSRRLVPGEGFLFHPVESQAAGFQSGLSTF